MADSNIAGLPSGAAIADTDLIAGSDAGSGTLVKKTGLQFNTYIQANLSNLPTTDPHILGMLWNNGGLVAISQPFTRALAGNTGSYALTGSTAALVKSLALSAETVQFFDRLITMPSSARQTVYGTLIDALVTAGVWAKLDALFLYAAADSATGLTNLVQEPHRGFLDVAIGVPTFTTDRGWSVCGSPGNKDTNANFNPSTAAGNYTQNDAMFCAWQIGTTQENTSLVADTLGDSKIEIFPRWVDGKTYWAINGNGTEVASTAPADGQGFWLAQRTGASASEIHVNDTSIGTSANASAALTNSFVISNPQLNAVGCLGIGGSMSSGQQTSFYNAMRIYMTAVGVP